MAINIQTSEQYQGVIEEAGNPQNDGILYSISNQNIEQSIVKNLYPVSSETIAVLNSNTTPGVTSGIDLVNPPANCRSGAQVGTSGASQYNISIPSSTDIWIFSFYAYQPPGVTGAQVNVAGNNGLIGTPNLTKTLIYDFDNPETASTNIFVGDYSASITYEWCVQDVGSGWKRFSIALIANATHTLFVVNLNGSAAANKAVYTGFMLERRPQTEIRLPIPSEYATTAIVAPYQGYGKKGLLYSSIPYKKFSDVRCFSDSIWGSGSTNFKLATLLKIQYGVSSCNVMSGQPLDTILTAVVTAIPTLQNSLVIINGGVNDGVTLSNYKVMINKILNTVNSLGHTNYIVCGILPKYKKSSNDGTEQTKTVNVTAYNAIMAFNDLASQVFEGKFINFHRVSVNGYDPLDAADIAAYNDDMRPPSLTGSNTDGLHPGINEVRVLADYVRNFIDISF